MKNKLTFLLITSVITGVALPAQAGKRDFSVIGELNCSIEEGFQRCYVAKTGAPFKGELRLYYPDGRLLARIGYADGRQDGKFLVYYKAGGMQRYSLFRNGRQNGIQTTYFDNGNVDTEKEYCDGLQCGFSRSFYPDGQVKIEISYSSGNRDGRYIRYYPDGKVAVRASFSQGKAVSGYCLMPDGQRKDLADELGRFAETEETPCDNAIEYAETHYSSQEKGIR